jgi:hypothetical protein
MVLEVREYIQQRRLDDLMELEAGRKIGENPRHRSNDTSKKSNLSHSGIRKKF